MQYITSADSRGDANRIIAKMGLIGYRWDRTLVYKTYVKLFFYIEI